MTAPPAPKGRAADWTDERRAQRGARREGGGPAPKGARRRTGLRSRGSEERATERRGKEAAFSAPGGARLRSDAWFRGDDEVALAHRVAFAAAGHPVTADGGRPVIGIANSASELNPCNLPLRGLVGPVADGIREAGGVPAEFGSISLGEDLMKPSAMLYRNLLAIEIEEIIRSNPLDGIVLLAGCDKTVPGAIMGAASADLPMVVVTSGARSPATFRGRRIGSGSDLWRLWDERRAPAGRRGLARAGTLPGLRDGHLQHDGHRVHHGHPGRDARPDDPGHGHHPGR